jgi:hypothetical protein
MTAFTSILPTTTPAVLPVTGTAQELARPTAHHTMIVFVEGVAAACRVVLQGSHDGTNWTDIGTVNSPSGGLVSTQPTTHLMNHIRAEMRQLAGPDGVSAMATIASDDGV